MEQSSEYKFTPTEYPPFPNNLPIAELETFSLSELNSCSLQNCMGQRLTQACRQDGCFYLDLGLHDGCLPEAAEQLMHLLEPLFRLPQEEKDKYRPADPLALFGYKKAGVSVVDKYNTPDCAEFFNVRRTTFQASRY